ncbi:MAG: hypothetical protein ABEK02_03295 [Haloquadratum sp.]
MSDHDETHGGHDDQHDGDGRVTAPMQDFGTSEVTTGLVVLVVGLLVVFGIPLLA